MAALPQPQPQPLARKFCRRHPPPMPPAALLLGLALILWPAGCGAGEAGAAGGWRPGPPREPTACGVARRRKLSPAAFAAEFRGRRPVLLEGHRNVRRARKHFTPEALLAAAGDAAVQVGDAAEIVRAHGQGPHVSTLREFVDSMRAADGAGSAQTAAPACGPLLLKERRRPLVSPPVSAAAEPVLGLLAPLSDSWRQDGENSENNGEKSVKNGREMAV